MHQNIKTFYMLENQLFVLSDFELAKYYVTLYIKAIKYLYHELELQLKREQ